MRHTIKRPIFTRDVLSEEQYLKTTIFTKNARGTEGYFIPIVSGITSFDVGHRHFISGRTWVCPKTRTVSIAHAVLNSPGGRGVGKKRMPPYNEADRDDGNAQRSGCA
jgi:hypothetical protein